MVSELRPFRAATTSDEAVVAQREKTVHYKSVREFGGGEYVDELAETGMIVWKSQCLPPNS